MFGQKGRHSFDCAAAARCWSTKEKGRSRSSLTGSMIVCQYCTSAGSAVVNGRVCAVVVVVVVEVCEHSFEDLKWSGWCSQPLTLTEKKLQKLFAIHQLQLRNIHKRRHATGGGGL